MNLQLDLQIHTKILNNYIPIKKFFVKWISYIFRKKKNIFITIQIVKKSKIKKLNFLYRKIYKPTNILSFSYKNIIHYNYNYIGDLVICHEIVNREACKKKISLESYWASISIHGSLHLLGYRHDNNSEFKKMRNIENKSLSKLGYINFYL
ncbi:rRNA maturation RNase YbeY [Buchnera aphidicola (Kurisakia onigurumii)]|uniref:rRNA maturation RNase YbeY n=1 Tax=Buchnera aphidicola TaxID=9 RepID=UPI0031B69B39